MLISIQGLRAGAGSSFCAANLAELYASANRPVALVSTAPAPSTFETYWGLPLTSGKSWVRQITSNQPLAEAAVRAELGFPVLFSFGAQAALSAQEAESTAPKLLAALSGAALTHVLVDAGGINTPCSQVFRSLATLVVTVLEPDHDSLLRLMEYHPLDNEVFVLNKVVPGSSVGYRLTSYLETEPRFVGKLITPVLAADEAARESGFLLTRVVKSAPTSAVSQSLGALAESLLHAEARLAARRARKN